MSFETFAVAAYTYYPVVWRKVYDDALRASHLWQPEATELDVLLMRVTGDAEKYDVFNGNKTIIALKNSSGAGPLQPTSTCLSVRWKTRQTATRTHSVSAMNTTTMKPLSSTTTTVTTSRSLTR